MLAELHGKLDPERNDAVERSEDLLTDAVFGALRYLPRHVLGAVLAAVGVRADATQLRTAQVQFWPRIAFPRWPGTTIEPDVIVVVGRQPVVFEAKLYSPFGWYLDPTAPDGPPLHQLAVQYAAVAGWAAGERLSAPIMVAVTAAPTLPARDLRKTVADIAVLAPEANAVRVEWLPWHRIGQLVSESGELRVHEQALIEDLLAFMERRGVRRVFTKLQPEDYWLVATAQRVAADRLYPEIRTFIEDLAAVLDEDGVSWSQPAYRSMWLGLGASVSKPTDWTRSFLGAQFWPTSWPKRSGRGGSLALYTLFDFLNPALEVGLSIPGPGVAVAQKQWPQHLPELATQLHQLEAEFEVVLDGGDVARPVRTAAALTVDEAWLTGSLGSLTTTAHLRLRQRSNALDTTVQAAREHLHSVQRAVDNCPALWALAGGAGWLVQLDGDAPPEQPSQP